MEPAEEPITQVRIGATVARCFPEDGKWWVQFEGSWECLSVGPITGDEPPPFFANQLVDIIIRKRK